jgi:adenylate cyclase
MAAGKSRSAKEISFGVGLHVGEVVLGNVGTTRRLDMTVTGPAANEVTRIEALTKTLGFSASEQFHGDDLFSIGKYSVPDLGGTAEIFTFVQARS